MKTDDRSRLALLGIIFVAFVLRIWKLGGIGLHHDPAHYAVRALGWFDFLVGVGQTTPIVWFGHIPWWANLSFHDHPPLAFLLQHLSFLFFGANTFAALLPHALADTAATFLLFFFVSKLWGRSEALLAAGLFAVSSFAIWSSRSGYLEGIEVLFIIVSFGSLSLFLFYEDKPKYLWWWGVATGLALLTKYTAAFLLPAAFLFLLLARPRVFKTGRFWFAVALILLLLLPVIIYNFQVYLTRGHFDAAITSLFGIKTEDFSVLQSRALSGDIFGNLIAVFNTLRSNISWPMFWTFILGGLALAIGGPRRKDLQGFVLLNLFFGILLFSLTGVADRFLPILIPFLAIPTAAALKIWANKLAAGRIWKYAFVVLVGAVFIGELAFAVNTNLLTRPKGEFYAKARFFDNGFEALDAFLRENAYGPLPKRRRITKLDETVLRHNVQNREVVLYDERIDWFQKIWYFDRYSNYYAVPVIPFQDVLAVLPNDQLTIFDFLKQNGALGVWVVIAQNANVVTDRGAGYDELMDTFMQDLRASGIAPIKEIRDYRGEVVFLIYHFK